MITDAETKTKGFRVLVEAPGEVEAERFVSLVMQEPFDYTKWRRNLLLDKTVPEISSPAMHLRREAGHRELSLSQEEALFKTSDLAQTWELESLDHFWNRSDADSGVEIHRTAGFLAENDRHLWDRGIAPVNIGLHTNTRGRTQH